MPMIVYIVPGYPPWSAASVNTQRRKRLMEKLGYYVLYIQHEDLRYVHNVISIVKRRKNIKAIIIRADGGCDVDKYTLLKLLLPNIPLIWEIHGFAEEQLTVEKNLYGKWFVLKNNTKRRILSRLVDCCMFVSEELRAFAREKITVRRSVIIPNFLADEHAGNAKQYSNAIIDELLQNYFVVLWGGDARMPWQAVDTIYSVATRIHEFDRRIAFIVVGSNSWSSYGHIPNMLCINPMPHADFMHLVSKADVCLGIYHESVYFPFYFYPMKILDYMSVGKPVIATHLRPITRLITDGVNGFLTTNTVSDITKKILLIKQNRPLSRRLAHEAKKTVQNNYSERNAKRQYTQLFLSVNAGI